MEVLKLFVSEPTESFRIMHFYLNVSIGTHSFVSRGTPRLSVSGDFGKSYLPCDVLISEGCLYILPGT